MLLLSRSVTTGGTASVVVAVPAGTHQTQTIYLQGVAQGSTAIQAIVNGGAAQVVATVSITASWVSCGNQPISLNTGTTLTLKCSARYDIVPSFTGLQEIGPRAGFTDLKLTLTSSATDVFTVAPESVTLSANTVAVSLHGVAPGTGVLKLAPPASFGPSPDGSETVMVRVTPPPLTGGCGAEVVVGMDTQYTCAISAVTGTITATSGDPTLLLVSADANAVGEPSASVVSDGRSVSFTFQALAAYGTVEVVISAPGYRDLHFAIAMRPSQINLAAGQTPPLSLKIGGSRTLGISMRVAEYTATPRAGANIAIDLSTDQAGIVSLNPAHLVLSGPQSKGDVQVNAVAAGSTLVRMTVPTGYLTSGTPLAVTVAPEKRFRMH